MNQMNLTTGKCKEPSYAHSSDTVKTRLQLLRAKEFYMSEETLAILGHFAPQLRSTHAHGVTYESLANALGQCGILVGIGELEAFLRSTQGHTADNFLKITGKDDSKATAIVSGLRTALDSGDGLFLQYQPQIDMESSKVVGAEALVRWRNGPSVVSPDDFIPIAEQSDLIREIGAWTMREACTEAVRWHRMGLGQGQGIKISVNLSVKQFSEQLAAEIRQLLQTVGLSTDLFGVEITESFLAGSNARDILQSIRAMGVQVAIDDFGTGYSCLAHVSSLPLNTIKIDRAFVVPLGRSFAADAVAETIIALANKLGMKTIAEGVETPIQVNALKSLGCKVAQGFLYARPLSPEEFIKFVRTKEKNSQQNKSDGHI